MEVLYKGALPTPVVKLEPLPFDFKSMKDVISEDIEPAKMLVGDLVFLAEVTILFGKSNVGKSILSISFADAISKGIDLDLGNGIILENQCEPLKTILFDFEMSPQQIQKRYDKHYSFDEERFIRATLKRGEYLESDPKEVVSMLKLGAEQNDCKCIIIDNISAISGDIEKSANAVPFMQSLMKLAKDEGFTVIVMAHTPKLKDYSPLSVENVSGSNKINQLTDGVVAIGKVNCDADDEVYIIHLKGRNGSKTYNKGNVIHSKISKVNGMVRHVAQSTRSEADLLTNISVDTPNAPNRELCTYACMYYGSSRKAQTALKEIGLEIPHTTINNNYNAFKSHHKAEFEIVEKYDVDALKELLESKSPNQNSCLPLRDGHVVENDNEAPY